MKKIVYIGFIATGLISPVYANNFYAGIGAGYQSAEFIKKLYLTNIDATPYHQYKTDKQPGIGFVGNIFGGYKWHINRFNIATELNANLSSLKYYGFVTETEAGANNTSQAEYTIRQGYGISLLPGYQITDTTDVYVRLGYQRSNFKYSEFKTDAAGTRTGVTEHEWLNGIRYGLGINTAITSNAGLRLEFDQTKYNTFTNISTQMVPGKYRRINLTPYVNQVELDFVYNFA